jgi:phosphoenolpyruvate-protein phosphotransferase (PTS system enzyme I)
MRLFKGLPVSSGIVIGRVLVIDESHHKFGRRTIKAAGTGGTNGAGGTLAAATAAEVARFDAAVKASIDELRRVHTQAEKEMGKDAAKIFLFHVGMLSDPAFLGQVRGNIEKELLVAESAVEIVIAAIADKFRAMNDQVFTSKVNDLEDLSDRLRKRLVGAGMSDGRQRIVADENTIIVARDLTPSQTAGFDRSKVRGFATDLGGKTSHTAIIAKALEIPAVVGCQTLLREAQDGDPILLDGERGEVILYPDEATLAQAKRTIEQNKKFRVLLTETSDLPSVTKDGVAVHLVGNIELPEEINKVLKAGGEGVGLYRTEYLYLTGNTEPTEADHFRAYKKCVELLKKRELVIRTVDLGADKYTQAQEEVPERNPFLGNRSIRYCLKNLPMFKRQIRAILRASALGPVKMMFPLISSITELRHAKYIVNDVMEELEEESMAFDRGIKIGMMVEVPSAALLADTFAREVDFFSIGTNDLVQYTLAVDRINERVAHLYSHTHPAVIKLIRDVARASRRRKIPTSCCGEAAGDPDFALLLVGLGLRTLSVSSSSIPPLKRFLRGVTVQQCERVARQVLSLDSDASIAALLRDRARAFVPDAFDGRSAEA